LAPADRPTEDTNNGGNGSGIPALAEGLARLRHTLSSGRPVTEHNGHEPILSADAAFMCAYPTAWPILICMLGGFRLLRSGQRVAIRSGGKMELLLCNLGLHYGPGVPRATLVNTLWPDSDAALGAQSLNSLIYQLHKLVDNGKSAPPLVVHDDGQYRLNPEAGVGVDATCFEMLAHMGDQHARGGDLVAAVEAYSRAVETYQGDLCLTTDVHAILMRERLRNRCLTLLGQIADYHYSVGDYDMCLNVAWRLMEEDPCREDAHRLVMRSYVKLGQRAAAVRHYHTCAQILRAEIDADPEPATTALLQQIRLRPDLI
jgi:DNA-binding SARP family transcriptional activator